MTDPTGHSAAGVACALGAALLFGAGTPLAKQLLGSMGPWMLAGLCYLGSGLGLALYRLAVRAPPVRLVRSEWLWLASAILAGGVLGPLLLMWGLSGMPASGASLLLNAEAVFTALLAWWAFGEHVDRRIALGMLAIAAGVLLLGWPQQVQWAGVCPAVAVLGASLCWGLDNNLTRKVALTDASWIASAKGLVAGSVNLGLALSRGDTLPAAGHGLAAMAVGLLAYGVSLALFVRALRHLGTARTGAYFSVAPFFGALLAVLGGEAITPTLLGAAALMALGVGLHLSERHVHMHMHEPLEHAHDHVHDAHHQHAHGDGTPASGRHSHWHRHEALRHSHAHYPDAHHRHSH